MKVWQVLAALEKIDPQMDVAIEQIFNEYRSIELRSIEVFNNCVTFKDHYVRISEHSAFISFDGREFNVPTVATKYLSKQQRADTIVPAPEPHKSIGGVQMKGS